jgi:hypothetical protein
MLRCSGYQTVKWVRYLSRAGPGENGSKSSSYEVRITDAT